MQTTVNNGEYQIRPRRLRSLRSFPLPKPTIMAEEKDLAAVDLVHQPTDPKPYKGINNANF